MSVKELEQAVQRLDPESYSEFSRWFIEFDHDRWDRQIEADSRAGKLDELVRRADQDFEAGRCKPL
ncbi:MAG TPA: hypothetical protein VKT77_10375 [Chthonomonadaceae bacterium]|nr:hypothetical protein [Chthonomonadaceae bacterium]